MINLLSLSFLCTKLWNWFRTICLIYLTLLFFFVQIFFLWKHTIIIKSNLMLLFQLADLMRTDLSLANTEHYNDRYVNNSSNCNNVNNNCNNNVNNHNNPNFGGKIQIAKGSAVELCPLIMLISHQNLQLVELMFEKKVLKFFSWKPKNFV